MSLLFAGKMFTLGRIIFVICFIVVFVMVMIFSYRKDAKNHSRYYKGTAIYVAITLLATIAILIVSKYLFK